MAEEQGMAETAKANSDLAAITEDISALKRDLAALADHMKRGAVSSAAGAASQITEGAYDIYGRLAAEGVNSAKAIGRHVEEQPVSSLLLAFALGFLGSRLLPR